jgi:hypothetical protein
MNLVFGSLFLFILISPGLLFRFAYLQGSYAKLSFKVSAVDEILWALIPAFLFHFIGLWYVEHILHIPVRLDLIYELVTGKETDFIFVKSSLTTFIIYMAALLKGGAILGFLSRVIVRKLRFDLYWKFLRFGNEWYYLLSGEMLNLPERESNERWYTSTVTYFRKVFKPKAQVELIQVDAVIKSSEGDLIYSGILKDYFLSKDNGLDRIYLSNVYRRSFKNDLQDEEKNPGFLARDTDERYYAMPGDFFVITYDKIQNLNITYYLQDTTVEEVSDESSPEQTS